MIGLGAAGGSAGHAPRLRSAAGDDHDPTLGGLLVLAGVGALAFAGALVERRRT